MVYTVVLIVIGGTLFTHKVGKRIRPLNVEKQRSEATFRTNLVQHNKQAELIALSNAESLQRQELSENFHTIKENWHRLMNRQRWLDYWQNIYSRSLSVLPYFLLLPQFISGQINPVSYTHLDVYKRQAIPGSLYCSRAVSSWYCKR